METRFYATAVFGLEIHCGIFAPINDFFSLDDRAGTVEESSSAVLRLRLMLKEPHSYPGEKVGGGRVNEEGA